MGFGHDGLRRAHVNTQHSKHTQHTSWTQVSAASATSVNLFLPAGARRQGTNDTIEVVVQSSSPANSVRFPRNAILIQNSNYQPGALLNLPLGTDEEAYARWVGPSYDTAADMFVVRA